MANSDVMIAHLGAGGGMHDIPNTLHKVYLKYPLAVILFCNTVRVIPLYMEHLLKNGKLLRSRYGTW